MLSDVLDQIEERGAMKERKAIKSIIVKNMLKSKYSDEEIKRIPEITDNELADIKRQFAKLC